MSVQEVSRAYTDLAVSVALLKPEDKTHVNLCAIKASILCSKDMHGDQRNFCHQRLACAYSSYQRRIHYEMYVPMTLGSNYRG